MQQPVIPIISAQHNWLWFNWGNLASVVGLVISILGLGFTIWTLITAKSAKLAANEARDAANVRLLTDEIRRGENLSKELAGHLVANRLPEALIRAQDLADLLLSVYEFWAPKMKEQQTTVTFEAKNDAEQVLAILRKIMGADDDPRVRDISKARIRNDSVYHAFIKIRASLELERK